MGQYYRIVNLTKHEIITPQDDEYSKLTEFAYTTTPSIEQLWLNLSGRWKNDIVFLCGDYYDSTGIPEYNPYAAELERMCGVNPGELYEYTQNNFKEVFIDLTDKPKIPKYAVNPVTKTYVNRDHAIVTDYWTDEDDYDDRPPKKYHTLALDPLALLLTGGNGQGGGDYWNKEGQNANAAYVGSWIKDSASVYTVFTKAEIPDGFTEFCPDFRILDVKEDLPDFRLDDPQLTRFLNLKLEQAKQDFHIHHNLKDGGMQVYLQALIYTFGKELREAKIDHQNETAVTEFLKQFRSRYHLQKFSFAYNSYNSADWGSPRHSKPYVQIYLKIPMKYGKPYHILLASVYFCKRKNGNLYNIYDVDYVANPTVTLQECWDYHASSDNIQQVNEDRKARIRDLTERLKPYSFHSLGDIAAKRTELTEELDHLQRLYYDVDYCINTCGIALPGFNYPPQDDNEA